VDVHAVCRYWLTEHAEQSVGGGGGGGGGHPCELHAVHVPCAVPPQPETYCPDGHTGHAEHEPRSGAVASRARGQESGNGLHGHGAAHTIAHAAAGVAHAAAPRRTDLATARRS